MTTADDAPLLRAHEILAATTGILLRGSLDWSCRGISTDTRTLQPGNLFIALSGENFDGHDYLTAAAAKGTAGLLIDRRQAARLDAATKELPVIAVADTLVALGAIAHAWRRRFTIPVLAITGSAGKTTTKEMILAIASQSRCVLATTGNFNNQIGLPFTLLELRPEHTLAVIEMGTNSPGEIARLAAIAAPEFGLITNIGPAHLEGLGSLAAVREEKGALFATMAGQGTAILNADDPQIALLAGCWPGKAIRFGLAPGVEVTAAGISAEGRSGTRFDLLIAGQALPVHLAVPGRHNVLNGLGAAAAATALGFGPEAIAMGLSAFRPVPGRMEIRPLANGAYLIMDAYNANPASVREALATLREVKGTGRAFVVLGDMLELGEASVRLHEEIGALAAETGVERLFLKGEFAGSTAQGAKQEGLPEARVSLFAHPEAVAEALKGELSQGDWILVKGSRKMKLELVAERIISAFDLRPQTL